MKPRQGLLGDLSGQGNAPNPLPAPAKRTNVNCDKLLLQAETCHRLHPGFLDRSGDLLLVLWVELDSVEHESEF